MVGQLVRKSTFVAFFSFLFLLPGRTVAPPVVTGSSQGGCETCWCECYWNSDCNGEKVCDRTTGCLKTGKLDGTCKDSFMQRPARRVASVAATIAISPSKAADLYFQSYLTAITRGGGLPDPELIKKAQEIPLSEELHKALQMAIWNALDRVIGWDFDFPSEWDRLLNKNYLGNIRQVEGVGDALGIVDATRKGVVEAIQTGNPEAIVEPLANFWKEHPKYQPKHTGRCYRHGHTGVENPEDTLTCQTSELKAILKVLLRDLGAISP